MPKETSGYKRQSRGGVRYETDQRNCSGKAAQGLKTEKHDRRSVRTQRALGEALIALLVERRYADLTVQDILERADIGRSTFYTHYWDKDDLLTSTVEQMVASLNRQLQTAEAQMTLIPSLALLQHVDGQRPLYRALVRGQGVDLVLRAIQQRLSVDAVARLRTLHPGLPETTLNVTAQAMTGALLTLMQWWLTNETNLSPAALDDYFRQLMLPGIGVVVQGVPRY